MHVALACLRSSRSFLGRFVEGGLPIVRGIRMHDDACRRHGDYHSWQRPVSMSRRRAQLERLAKRGLLLVVNGAPIDAAANVHERPQRRPQAIARRCESECSRYCSYEIRSPFDLKRLQHV